MLFEHARNCTTTHCDQLARLSCESAKLMMLHVRDCKGIANDGTKCQHVWCRQVKEILEHLLCCENRACPICTPDTGLLEDNNDRFSDLYKHNFLKRINTRKRAHRHLSPTSTEDDESEAELAARGLLSVHQSNESLPLLGLPIPSRMNSLNTNMHMNVNNSNLNLNMK